MTQLGKDGGLVTGLDRVFTIYPTRDEAVSNVKSAARPPA